jgi:hypothetical protein
VTEAFKSLGVRYPTDDWATAWRQVLGAFWTSIRAMRLGIQSSPPVSSGDEVTTS